jgi:hypothetical protein
MKPKEYLKKPDQYLKRKIIFFSILTLSLQSTRDSYAQYVAADHLCDVSATGKSVIGQDSAAQMVFADSANQPPKNAWAACCSYGTNSSEGSIAPFGTGPDRAKRFDCLETPGYTTMTASTFDANWALVGDNNLPAAVQAVNGFGQILTGWFTSKMIRAGNFSEFVTGGTTVNIARGNQTAFTNTAAPAISLPEHPDNRVNLSAVPTTVAEKFQYPYLVRAFMIFKCPDVSTGLTRTDGTNRRCAKADQIDIVIQFKHIFQKEGEPFQSDRYERKTLQSIK